MKSIRVVHCEINGVLLQTVEFTKSSVPSIIGTNVFLGIRARDLYFNYEF